MSVIPVSDAVGMVIAGDMDCAEMKEFLCEAARRREAEDPALAAVLSKDKPLAEGIDAAAVLKRNGLPHISTGFRRFLREKRAAPDPACVRDGHAFLFRGDYPGLGGKGIYSYAYARYHASLDQMLALLEGEGIICDFSFTPRNKLEDLMNLQSKGGYEPFVSATAKFETATIHPKYEEADGVVYVVRVPLQHAFRNYASTIVNRSREGEVLVADYVSPDEILAAIKPSPGMHVDVRDFM